MEAITQVNINLKTFRLDSADYNRYEIELAVDVSSLSSFKDTKDSIKVHNAVVTKFVDALCEDNNLYKKPSNAGIMCLNMRGHKSSQSALEKLSNTVEQSIHKIGSSFTDEPLNIKKETGWHP
jgi:hypothetical protein